MVLALFDDRACDDVLDLLGDAVGGRLLVNTSTVSVVGAEGCAERVRRNGGRYVHAPVLGSVPAVLSGTLRVLAGGESCDVDEARTVLEPLAGQVRHLGGPWDAAAAKLVANSSPAGSVLALRDPEGGGRPGPVPVRRARRARARPARRGGPRIREKLEQSGGDPDFTVSALAKDVGLLGDHPVARRIRELAFDEDADVSVLALPPAYAQPVVVTR